MDWERNNALVLLHPRAFPTMDSRKKHGFFQFHPRRLQAVDNKKKLVFSNPTPILSLTLAGEMVQLTIGGRIGKKHTREFC